MFKKEAQSILDYLDDHVDELAKTAVDLGGLITPVGHEKPAADYVHEWLMKNGFESRLQHVMGERYNALGFLRGSGGGKSLLFNSHLDIEVSKHTAVKAFLDGDVLVGSPIVNDKGPMTAWMWAAKAIKEKYPPLLGDLVLGAVVGETDTAPVDEFQGPDYYGGGLGSAQLVKSGIITDYALVAETTGFVPTWVEAGQAWFKVTVFGENIYTPRLVAAKSIAEHPNAIVKCAKVVLALEDWAKQYEEKHRMELDGGRIVVVPKVNVGAIRGGRPFKPVNTADECSIYVDVRLPPGEGPLNALTELRAVVNDAEDMKKAMIEQYMFRRGYVGEGKDELLAAIQAANKYVRNEDEFGKVNSPETSMWRDTNVFNEVGIPSITFGPPRVSTRHGGLNYGTNGMRVQDLLATAKIYALTAIDICSTKKKPASS